MKNFPLINLGSRRSRASVSLWICFCNEDIKSKEYDILDSKESRISLCGQHSANAFISLGYTCG